VPDPARPHDEVLGELQDLARVRAAIDLLDPRSRQLIELLFLQDDPLPYDEVARRMNMPEGSIGPTRARCLAKIRQCLTKL
jgi:RNA polymerase sigma factor (sigma-70 family)